MNLAKYQALLSAVESGSLTAAAAQLGLTQPRRREAHERGRAAAARGARTLKQRRAAQPGDGGDTRA